MNEREQKEESQEQPVESEELFDKLSTKERGVLTEEECQEFLYNWKRIWDEAFSDA